MLKRKERGSLLFFHMVLLHLAHKKKRNSLPITDKNQDWSCLYSQYKGRRRGRGRRKGNGNLKSKVSWWKKGFRQCHSNKKLSCFGSDFPLPQSYIPLWDGYGLQSPCCGQPHSCICMEWARGSNEVYCSLQVRAGSSALWALRGTVKSGAGFPSHRAATVTASTKYWRKALQSCEVRLKCGQPLKRFNPCPPTELFCGSARTRGDMVADAVWGRELGSNTGDAIKGSREDKMQFFLSCTKLQYFY